MRQFPNPYRTPTGEYELNPSRGFFEIVVPEASKNLVTNPSIEIDTTGYIDTSTGTLERSMEKQVFGGYSLKYTPDNNPTAGVYYSINVTPELVYTASAYVWGVNSERYRFYLYDNDQSFILSEVQFTGRGAWVRYTVTGTAGTGISDISELWIVVRKNNNDSLVPFYLDGVQLEQKGYATTYLDGDMPSLLAGQKAFFWLGTRHASQSVRIQGTNAGGRVRRLDEMGFHAISIVGLGMAPITNISNALALTGGASYQRTLTNVRPFTLIGDVTGYNLASVQRQRKNLLNLLQPFKLIQQPMLLRYQLYECDNLKSQYTELQCVYSGGMEGSIANNNHERLSIQFQAFSPYPQAVLESAVVVDDAVINNPGCDFLVQRKFDLEGVTTAWNRIAQGTDNLVLTSAWGPDGRLYIGGVFINAIQNPPGGSLAVNHIAVYDPLLDQWDDLDTGVNGTVRSMAFDTEGNLYVGGEFTTAGSGATVVDRIAKWDGAAWSALTTGVQGGVVWAVAIDSNNNVFVGGTFNDAGGVSVDRIAKWDGSAWSALVTFGTGPNAAVYALEIDLSNDDVYFGGAFTTGGGGTLSYIGRYIQSSSTMVPLGAGVSGTVYTILLNNSKLYVGGALNEAGGNDVGAIPTGGKIALWDGATWSAMGGGLSGGDVFAIEFDPTTGKIYVGGSFTTFYQSFSSGPYALDDGFVGWNGVAWFYPDVQLPNTPATVYSILGRDNGDFVVGHDGTGNSITTQLLLPNNEGSAAAYPRIFMFGEGYVRQIINYTTNEAIFFNNLRVLPGEIVVLDLAQKTLASNIRGNLLSKVAPGSDTATFRLIPGQNVISVYLPDALAEVNILWHSTYLSIDGAVS